MTMRVLVAVALPGRQEVLEVELPQGATLADAIAAARLGEHFTELDVEGAAAGIWSRAAKRDTLLRDGDRVEIYRPLTADAKDMRRARARVKPASTRSRNGP